MFWNGHLSLHINFFGGEGVIKDDSCTEMLWGNGNSKVSPMNGPKVSQTYGLSYGLTWVGARDACVSKNNGKVAFWKTSEKGGGVISDPKSFVADIVGFI